LIIAKRNTNKPPYAVTDLPYAPKRRPTVKQIEVLIHRADGLTQEKVAEIMGVSRSTVRDHIRALKKRGIDCP